MLFSLLSYLQCFLALLCIIYVNNVVTPNKSSKITCFNIKKNDQLKEFFLKSEAIHVSLVKLLISESRIPYFYLCRNVLMAIPEAKGIVTVSASLGIALDMA